MSTALPRSALRVAYENAAAAYLRKLQQELAESRRQIQQALEQARKYQEQAREYQEQAYQERQQKERLIAQLRAFGIEPRL